MSVRGFLLRLKPSSHIGAAEGDEMTLCGIVRRTDSGPPLVETRWYCGRCVRLAMRKLGAEIVTGEERDE